MAFMPPLVSPGIQGTEGPPPAPAGTKMADLLKPTRDVPTEPYVHYGKVQVQRELNDDFVKAQTYLGKSQHAVNSLHDLRNGQDAVKVEKITTNDVLFSPDQPPGTGGTIKWNPNSALTCPDGSRQTAANGLLHEQGHANELHNHDARYDAQKAMVNQRYGDGDEQRNIAWERTYSKELGEGTREDHGGLPFAAKGPTSIEPSERAMTEPAKVRQAIHDARGRAEGYGYPPPPEPGPGDTAIAAWDGKAHTGPVVHLDGGAAAQYVADGKGGGQYQVYDVQKDLGGHMPPENNQHLTISDKGQFPAPHAQQHEANVLGGR
jgi:hypothetical protein